MENGEVLENSADNSNESSSDITPLPVSESKEKNMSTTKPLQSPRDRDGPVFWDMFKNRVVFNCFLKFCENELNSENLLFFNEIGKVLMIKVVFIYLFLKYFF